MESNMTLDAIRLFILSAKYLNMTRAARDLGITQSTASKQLKKLQDYLGKRLIKNNGGRIELTPAGQDFLADAVWIVTRVDAFKQKHGRESQQSLTIAGSHGPCAHLLPSLMSQFTGTHPSLRLDLRTGTSAEVQDWTLAAEVDLAVVATPTRSPSLQMEPFRTEKLIAFVAPGHRLARKKSVHPSEFGNIQLIVRNRRKGQSRTETQLSDFAKRGIKFKTVTRYESSGSVKEAVRHGTGVGILFQDTVKREIDQGEFIAVQFAGFNVTRQTYIAYSKERPLSPIAREFLSLLRASATKDSPIKTVTSQISNTRRNGQARDYILRSKLLY
jgi:LysR family transcriptional regulator, low CO2-responsive transcriptional regulator